MTELAHSSAEFVRQHPELFVGPAVVPDLRVLAGDLAVDALVLGATSVTVEHFEEWFVVAAKDNWLTRNTKLTLLECFHRIQRFPELRANANRTPVVITAFAANILVFGSEGKVIIKGRSNPALTNHLIERFSGWHLVAFSGLVQPYPPTLSASPLGEARASAA